MQISDEHFIPVPRDVLWNALNDPAALKFSIPRCEAIARNGDGTWAVQVKAKIGPVPARFKGVLNILDVDAPSTYRLHFEGVGKVAELARCDTRVALQPATKDGKQGTTMQYVADLHLGGALSRFGPRVLDGAARRTMDEFCERLAEFLVKERRA